MSGDSMQIVIQGQDESKILIESFPEKGLIGITSIHPTNVADGDAFHTALVTVKEAGAVIAALQIARDFVGTWNEDHAAKYEAYRAKYEKKPELCGRIYSGVFCDMPKGSKCPDCGPACHDFPAGE